MNIYLAARYSRHPEMQSHARDLALTGHEVTAHWIWGSHERPTESRHHDPQQAALWAQEDWDDLAAADVVVAFTEPSGDVKGRGRGGRHVELGGALGMGKRVIVVGHRENIFTWLPQVEFYETWEGCLQSVFQPTRRG